MLQNLTYITFAATGPVLYNYVHLASPDVNITKNISNPAFL